MFVGTVGMLISNWVLKPAKYYCVEEYSDRAIPFLLFNLAIRNIDATVIQCDSLTREIKTTYELKKGKQFSFISIALNLSLEDMKFDQVLMNPPYSLKWSADKKFLDDPRFKDYDLAPKSKADYAFLLHGLYHLKDKKKMAIVLPHGILFRGAKEGKIRNKLLQKGCIDAVIGLPENLFNATSIPTVILILKTMANDKSVMFIDASKYFEKAKNQNILREKDIQKIIHTYQKREDIERYAHLASFDEIKENDFNLNIPRYVDTFVPEPPVDLGEVLTDMIETDKEIHKTQHELAEMLKDLTSDDSEVLKNIQNLANYFSN